MEKIRVSKLMSEQGLCSRREADSYIERGWVLVDGVAGHRARHAHFSDPAHYAGEGRAVAAGRKRDGTAQQADRLRVGSSRAGLPARNYAGRRAIAFQRRPLAAAFHVRANLRRTRAGRPSRYRFDRTAGPDPGRPHRQAIDRREFRHRKRIPGARRGQACRHAASRN